LDHRCFSSSDKSHAISEYNESARIHTRVLLPTPEAPKNLSAVCVCALLLLLLLPAYTYTAAGCRLHACRILNEFIMQQPCTRHNTHNNTHHKTRPGGGMCLCTVPALPAYDYMYDVRLYCDLRCLRRWCMYGCTARRACVLTPTCTVP
jgi:hypothetical protein